MPAWESIQQRALFEWALKTQKHIYAHMFHIPNGGKRDVRVARKLKLEGVKAGVPDIFLALPNGKYHGMFIEMKATKEHASALTPPQKEWLARLNEAGYFAVRCKGWLEASNAIKQYLGLDPQKTNKEAANETWMSAA